MALSPRRKSEVRKTLFLSESNLVAGQYDPLAGEPTTDPGDTIRFGVHWDYTDDANRNLRNTDFRYVSDSGCAFCGIALEELTVRRVSISVFDRLNTVTVGPVEFSVCHVDGRVDPHVCVAILPDEACEFLP